MRVVSFPPLSLFFFVAYIITSYMIPGTRHFVISTEHTAVGGRHFYCFATVMESCVTMVHTFMLGHNITNTRHDHTKALAYRMLLLWYRHYCVEGMPSSYF